GKGLPEEIGAPAFMRIDVPNKAVIGPKRTSPILLADKSDTQLMLQGSEFGYGWIIVVDQETGRMTLTLANRENVFVLFGPCIVPGVTSLVGLVSSSSPRRYSDRDWGLT